MKASNGYLKISLPIMIVLLLAFTPVISAQKNRGAQSPVPENINVILQASCITCHGMTGGRFPRARLNLDRWAEYSASKEKEKALLICSAVRKGSMPPRAVRESKPELIPTKEQTEMICKWAQSLKPGKPKRQTKD